MDISQIYPLTPKHKRELPADRARDVCHNPTSSQWESAPKDKIVTSTTVLPKTRVTVHVRHSSLSRYDYMATNLPLMASYPARDLFTISSFPIATQIRSWAFTSVNVASFPKIPNKNAPLLPSTRFVLRYLEHSKL